MFDLTPEAFVDYFKNRFAGKNTEELLVLMLNKQRQIISELVYSQGLHASVNGDVQEIAKAISINAPRYVIFAHNHPNGSAEPSPSDDLATTKLTLLAMAHGVTVLDHIIISEENYFSYHIHGNLATIRDSFQDGKLMEKIKN